MNIKGSIILGLLISIFVACNSTKKTAPVTKTEQPEEAVTYSNTIKSLVNKKCIGCHKGYEAAGSLNLETYNGVKNAAQNGTLLQRINDNYKPMPKAGLMSEKNRGLFKKWADGGYQE